jgi:hypothetical protein
MPPELPPDAPEDPELPPLCPPEGIEGMLDPPPDEPPPLAPPEEPPLEPELPPLGMLELLPPELPDEPDDPDEPEEPDEPPDDGLGMLGEGMLDEEDCCWAQPPMRNAEIEPIRVVFAAMTSSRRRVWLWGIALSPVSVRSPNAHLICRSTAVASTVGAKKKSATAKLNAR